MVAIALLDNPPSRPIVRPAFLPRPGLGPLPPGAAALVKLEATSCRWPMGEVAEDGFSFCGAPRSRGSYCAAHRRMAYAGAGR